MITRTRNANARVRAHHWLAEALEPRTMLAFGPIGPEFRVSTIPEVWDQSVLDVGGGADGGFVVAWANLEPTFNSPSSVRAQRYTAAGERLGEEIVLRPAGLAAVDIGPGGDFFVVWQTYEQDRPRLYAQHYDASGRPSGDETLLGALTSWSQVFSVAADADGDFAVAWVQYSSDTRTDVYARRYNAAGHPLGETFLVNTTTQGLQTLSSVATDADGNLVVTWDSSQQDGDGRDVYARSFDAQGRPRGGEFRVNATTAGDQDFSAVAMDAAGDFVITWIQETGPGEGVYARRYSVTGEPLGGEFRVNTAAGDQFHARVASGGGGDFVVAWQHRGSGVHARRYSAAGEPLGSEFLAGPGTAPAIACVAVGGYVIGWGGSGVRA
jgi:hypothetical protein